MRRALPRWLERLPALLLVAVALHQLWLARTEALSAWSGGGFGMFSTTDVHRYRRVRVRATTADGSTIPVVLDDRFDYDLERTLYLPRSSRVQELATRLLRSGWVVAPGADGSPVARLADDAKGGASASPTVGDPATIRSIAIDTYTINFDRATATLTAVPIGHVESTSEVRP